jgi:hypothetical protein
MPAGDRLRRPPPIESLEPEPRAETSRSSHFRLSQDGILYRLAQKLTRPFDMIVNRSVR